MKIALLTDPIEAGSPGFANYVMGIVRALESAGGHEYTLVHRRAHPFYQGRHHEIPRGSSSFPLTRQWRLPLYLNAAGFDAVHDTYHFAPFLRRSKFARVMTIGDLTPLVTKTHSWKQRLAHLFLAPMLARRAHRIVTFSESSKRDIVRLFRVPESRITVTPLAASERFRPVCGDALEGVRRRLDLPERYLLHVGTLEPRKNIERLVRAYAQALPHISDEVAMVLVGRRGWGMDALPALIKTLGVSDRVLLREDVNDDDLPLVYNAALALVYPSLYEGFGLPPLEAMQCGVPVITSETSSLPEVVGDAAISIDPTSVDAIAGAMIALANTERTRLLLRDLGLARAREFSWHRCAQTTIRVYEEAVRTACAGVAARPQAARA